jgi:hypothetical protein
MKMERIMYLKNAVDDIRSYTINSLMAKFGLSYTRAAQIYEKNRDNGFFDEPWFRIIADKKDGV